MRFYVHLFSGTLLLTGVSASFFHPFLSSLCGGAGVLLEFCFEVLIDRRSYREMYRRRRFVCGLAGLSHHAVGRRLVTGGGRKPTDKANTSEGSKGGGNDRGELPPGFDAQKLRAMQQMLSSQPVEKQMEMMKKALEFQKTLGRIPGVGRLAQKNIEVMERLLKSVETQQQPPPQSPPHAASRSAGVGGAASGLFSGNTNTLSGLFQSASASAAAAAGVGGVGGGSSSGPTIDELKKINLGPEIEALFAELASMRAKKNSYRDKLHAKEEEFEKLQKELAQARETDTSLRTKLRKVEQDVVLLNSENMELKEHEKEWRQVRKRNEVLSDAVQRLQRSDAAQDRQRSDVLQTQLNEKEENLRSLQRKLERLRRRDPLLQFSRLCSDVARMCDAERDPAKELSDDAFAALQSCYEREQDTAWEAASMRDGAAAHAYVAIVRRLLLSRLPHANYDALVTVEGDAAALKSFVGECGFELHPVMAERYVVAAPATATASQTFLGPYAVGMALFLSGKMDAATYKLPFRLTAVCPNVSTTLAGNTQRATVQYETARASGPGGQAVNVTETQINAKLFIDGAPAYVAEAQDSRSALSNREAATEKLVKARRQQYNEQLAKQHRVEAVERQLVQIIVAHLKSNGETSAEAITPSGVVDMVHTAVEKGYLTRVDLWLVHGLQYLSRAATGVSAST
ncbi:type 11 methyltransferase [Trypanosoma conorhini]|uniref:Type 11 methyltransferase n=1 Tax=Trypanosoma conorhini TaxID=83891 RepID=A0A422Q3A2_9TRYP|nr:type 11 methyltransferase [Trypanosoma conorhini]RNF24456.1 type 11 methyltransferase [Trypanosoma conorhini]